MPVPDLILNKPVLCQGLDLFLEAFFALNADRALGPAGEGPIPWTAMKQYAEDYGITGPQRELLYLHLRALDNAYLKHKSEKAEQEAQQKIETDSIRHVPE